MLLHSIDLHSIQYIRELIVPKRLMSVLPIHVKMVPRASMHWLITAVHVYQALLGKTVRLTLTSA